MKRKLLFTSALLASSMFLDAQSWTVQNTVFNNQYTGVDDISTPSPGVAWCLGYDGGGTVINYIDFSRTTDGGTTWTTGTVGTDTTYKFSNISAINGDTAWVAMFDHIAGTGGGIWKTTNGGQNWAQQGTGLIFDAASFPDVVHFWDGDTGVAIGDPNGGYFEIYTTVDGGANWVRTPSVNIPAALTTGAGEYGLTNNYDATSNTIWFNTDRGRVYKSIDKGLHWTVSTAYSLTTAQGMNMKFLDDNNGLAEQITLATGARVGVKRTSDGGATWANQAITGKFLTSDFGRVPGTGMYISCGLPTGNKGTSYSVDSGATWIAIDTMQHSAFSAYDINNVWSGSFTYIDQTSFLMVDGVFKLDAWPSSVHETESVKADVNTYPNPSSGIVHMNFKAGKHVDVSASVVDLIGRTVYNEKFSNVTLFNHTFDFSFLPKGVYMLNLDYNGSHNVQKLIIQ
ncbi:MAG: T9SS type A sorting domain-containing protein [Bacteroidetes bacterium]|nr:T9SS type A sorting domain-containing protein [Bacteroidota bacterium]